MTFLPVLLGVALIAGSAVGVTHPAWPVPALAAGGCAWLLAIVAWYRGWRTAVVPVGLAGIVAVAIALGAAAVQAVATPSLVTTLEAARVLPRERPALDAPAIAHERSGSAAAVIAHETPGPAGAVRLAGTLTADAVIVGRAVLLRLEARRVWLDRGGASHEVSGGVVVTVNGGLAVTRAPAWRAGRTVTLVATLRRPRPYRNLGAADPAADLSRRRAALLASVKSAMLVDVRPGPMLAEAAAALRARARDALVRAAGARAAEAAAIGTAVLVGDRAGIDAALQDRLQRAGTYHVIAISGGNIALFTALVLALTRVLTRRRALGLTLAGVVLVAYAGVVGGGASVRRAAGMALVGIAAQLLDQRGAALNVLALTAGALVAVDPLLAVDVGFWLTTAATAGIMLGVPLRPEAQASRVRRWTRALVLTSVWAELALLPIVAAVFQQVTVAGLVLSAVAIPGMAVTQLAALAVVVADFAAPPLVPLAGACLRAGAWLVTESARLADAAPWTSWRVPPPAPVAIAGYYAVLGAWLWARHPARDTLAAVRVRGLSAVALPVAVVWVAVAPASLMASAPGDLRVTALDVGQGDALLVQFPNGRRLLVDAGGLMGEGRDLGDRVVGPALRARGIRRLDYLLVTHADADHVGGAAAIVRQFKPLEVWTGIPVNGDVATARLRAAADAVRAAWRRVQAGDQLEIGQVAVHVLHPGPADWERQRVRNDDSVVLSVEVGGVCVVLTADVGAAAEPAVAEALGRRHTSAGVPGLTVLKVGHHGSAGASSEAWLAAAAPAVAIVSVGAGNPFGHPAPVVLARLQASGAGVWRTDRDGEITVRTDGRAVEMSSFTGRRRWWHVQPR